MDTVIIFCATYVIILPVAVFLYYFLRESRYRKIENIVHALVICIVSYAIAKLLGHFYYDPRPFVVDGSIPLIPHAPDNGFPSDHTLLASALAAIVMCYRARAGYLLWLVALVIGAARVYAGVHHPIDILGSILIVLAVATAVHYMEKRWKNAIITQ
jgi:undecaprenyl-diphosphatase